MTFRAKPRSFCEQRNEHGVDLRAVGKELTLASALLSHAARAHDAKHRLIGRHGACGHLAHGAVAEQEAAGAAPGFEAVAFAARLRFADHDREVGDAVRHVHRRRHVADMAERRIARDDRPEEVGTAGKARGIGAAGVAGVVAMPLLAITGRLFVVEPADVAVGEEIVVERPQIEAFGGEN
jgi:hypothetical protein